MPGSASAETRIRVTNSGGEPTAPIATTLSGDAGFAVTSDICAGQSLAAAATCEIHFDGASAASRFDLTGAPWVRPDGVPIVEKAADLASGTGFGDIPCDSWGR